MEFFNYNGKIFASGTPVIAPANRGLRYGDGLFETIRCKESRLVLLDEHFARLWKGIQLLQFELPKLFTPDKLQQEIMDLLKKNDQTSARVRVAIIRGDGGLYEAKNTTSYIIETWPMDGNASTWNENGLHMGLYSDAKKMADNFANCKHNNFLPYVMGALYARENKMNDAIILNNDNRICDTTIANIFILKNEEILTPALTEGCIAGIMRKFIIQVLPAQNIPVRECSISKEMLLNADEVFCTNSIFNMRWISNIDNSTYRNTKSREIYDRLCKTNPEVFC